MVLRMNWRIVSDIYDLVCVIVVFFQIMFMFNGGTVCNGRGMLRVQVYVENE